MSAAFAVQMGRHNLAARKNDLYETPECATRALLRHEGALRTRIWEPACGRGAISRILIEAGHDVVSTDLVDYGYGQAGRDFLMERENHGCDQIVTNPPFKLMDEFVRHGLTLCRSVIVLARWAYAEGASRSDLIDGHLDRVWLGRERLPFMHRDGYEGPKNSNSAAPFAWFVFERQPPRPGAFMVQRISWRIGGEERLKEDSTTPTDPLTIPMFPDLEGRQP